jgi:uncharacterized protein YkwD
MKLTVIALTCIGLLNSCTRQEDIQIEPQSYSHSVVELDLLDKINHYRDSLGKGTLNIVEHASYICSEHNEYMISNGTLSHDYFYQRSENIKQVCGATRVGEILGYNYSLNSSVLRAWQTSPTHDTLIRSEFRRIGISISTNPVNNRKFYTVIFFN